MKTSASSFDEHDFSFGAPAEGLTPDRLRRRPPVDLVPVEISENSSSTANQDIPIILPQIAVRKPEKFKKDLLRFELLQLWEGCVKAIHDDDLVAIISDRTDPTLPDEEVTLDLSDVPPGDLPLVKPGAVFYWSIGYADYPGVPRARQSRIYFRRIAGWTDTELENSKREAHRLAERFTFD
jgi:hypothetical protein